MGAHSKKKYRSRNSNYMNFRVRNDVHAAVAADFREWKNTEGKKFFFFSPSNFQPRKENLRFPVGMYNFSLGSKVFGEVVSVCFLRCFHNGSRHIRRYPPPCKHHSTKCLNLCLFHSLEPCQYVSK